jgi:hypothetical protein
MTPVWAKRLKLLALALGAIALFSLVDLPQTVRIKAMIINLLPLDADSKSDIVTNLCDAAAAGSTNPNESAIKCRFANDAALVAVFRNKPEGNVQPDSHTACVFNDSEDERTCFNLASGKETREKKTASGDWQLVEERQVGQH